jgi:hypothetical protein
LADHDITQQPSRRARDRSIVILMVGVALLMPPIAPAVLMDDRVFGLPLPLLYIFVVWAGLIVCAIMNSRALREVRTALPGVAEGKRAPAPHDQPPDS